MFLSVPSDNEQFKETSTMFYDLICFYILDSCAFCAQCCASTYVCKCLNIAVLCVFIFLSVWCDDCSHSLPYQLYINTAFIEPFKIKN